MLHILFVLLKILGILLLCMLLFLLAAAGLLLFYPLTYRLEGSLYGKPEGKGQVSWLCHLVTLKFSYIGEKAEYAFYVLGRRLRTKEEKEQKRKEKNAGKPGKAKRRIQNKKQAKNGQKKKKKPGQDEELLTAMEKKESAEVWEETEAQNVVESQKAEESSRETENVSKETASKETVSKEIVGKETGKDKTEKEEDKKTDERQDSAKKNATEAAVQVKKDSEKNSETKISLLRRWMDEWKKAWKTFTGQIRHLKEKKEAVAAFIRHPGNRTAFLFAKNHVFRLLKHILPGKLHIRLHYGLEDPADTGMLTGIFCIFYPKCVKTIQLMPDFEKLVFEGELLCKGHVQIGRVLWAIVRIYRHKECNRIIRMIREKN